jgi:hypothetical protein
MKKQREEKYEKEAPSELHREQENKLNAIKNKINESFGQNKFLLKKSDNKLNLTINYGNDKNLRELHKIIAEVCKEHRIPVLASSKEESATFTIDANNYTLVADLSQKIEGYIRQHRAQ